MIDMIKLRSDKGFSILDALVASMIVGLGLTGVMNALPAAQKAYKKTENKIMASILYYSAASHIKSLAFTALPVGGTGSGDFSSASLGETLEGGTGWNWEYQISNFGGGYAAELARKATVSLSSGTYRDTFTLIVINDQKSP